MKDVLCPLDNVIVTCVPPCTPVCVTDVMLTPSSPLGPCSPVGPAGPVAPCAPLVTTKSYVVPSLNTIVYVSLRPSVTGPVICVIYFIGISWNLTSLKLQEVLDSSTDVISQYTRYTPSIVLRSVARRLYTAINVSPTTGVLLKLENCELLVVSITGLLAEVQV